MAQAGCDQTPKARGDDRRDSDRRARNVSIEGADRRAAERRSGRERRDS